jgi:hypothetical protein
MYVLLSNLYRIADWLDCCIQQHHQVHTYHDTGQYSDQNTNLLNLIGTT